MLWKSDNILIKDSNNKLVDCVNCPCGAYGVFGFKYRYVDNTTNKPFNQCRWQFDLIVCKVQNNQIIPPFVFDDEYITINGTSGLVASGTNSFNCYQQCVNYDENDQCIYQTYCDYIQYQCYCLLYDNDYNNFKNKFYQNVSSITPTDNIYPNVFNSYGDLTSDGITGKNYWNNYFLQRYSLSYKTVFYNGVQNWNLWAVSQYDDGEASYNESTAIRTTGNNKGDILDSFDIRISNEYQITCQQQLQAVVSNTPQLVNYVKGKANNRQQYFIATSNSSSNNCNNSNYLCKQVQYQGLCWDNYYCSPFNVAYTFQLPKFRLQRNDNTPSFASGVVFQCETIYQRWDENNSSDSSSSSSISEISVSFGQQYNQFPIPTNITWMDYIEYPICAPNGVYLSGEYKVVPDYQFTRWCGMQQSWGTCYRQKYRIKLIGLRWSS